MVEISEGRTRSDSPSATTPALNVAMVVPPWYEMPPKGYGGLEAICSALVDALVDRGHNVTLFGAGERSGTKANFVSATNEPQFRRLGESMPDVLHAARAQRYLATGDFDIIHDHTMPGALTAAGRLMTPTVVTVHGPVDGELGDYFEAIGTGVALVAISEDQRQVRPDLPWVATVHNGIQVPDQGALDRRGPAMWVARFSPAKGPDLAITAARAANLPLILAGKCNEPDEERYLDEVIRPMIDDDTELLVNPDRVTVVRLLRHARCLLLPIRWREPFGMVMIEAMALGIPVVALRRGAVPEIVHDGVTGFICGSTGELPAAMHKVPDIDGQRCIDHVRTHFSAGVMAARYEAVYRAVIAERSPWNSSRSRLAASPHFGRTPHSRYPAATPPRAPRQ
jgi:glycosyltransferase involved in cell wall biosynthesis